MASGTSSYQRPAGRETGAIAKERYYDNTYPDFDPREPNDYIVKDKESYQVRNIGICTCSSIYSDKVLH